MPEYLVTWEINVDADSPKEAAEEALRIQRDPDSIALVFVVRETDYDDMDAHQDVAVDLWQEP